MILNAKGEQEAMLGCIRVPQSMLDRMRILSKESGYKVPELRRLAYQHFLNTVSIKPKEESPNE